MDDRFEATFVVDVPAETVWAAFTEVEQVPDGPPRWWLPGFEATGEQLEMEAGRLLHVRKDVEPCKGTEIVVTLEAVDSGTKVTVVQSGFGAFFGTMLDALEVGWSQIVADLVCKLEWGVAADRYTQPWNSPGLSAREVTAGLEVTEVQPGGFAGQVGLAPGDLLLTVGGAPVFTYRDLLTLMRAFRPGEKIEASWARENERLTGAGVL